MTRNKLVSYCRGDGRRVEGADLTAIEEPRHGVHDGQKVTGASLGNRGGMRRPQSSCPPGISP